MFTQAELSPNHRIATTPGELAEMVEAMKQHPIRGFDFETSGLRYWDGQRPIGVAEGALLEAETDVTTGARRAHLVCAWTY